MSKKEIEPPCGNPYTVLGLKYGATDAEISKAYKRYALLYHPDKQQQQKDNHKKAIDITKKFHNVTEAKSFLLDAEHAETRNVYDLQIASKLRRKEEEDHRDKSMNAKRRLLRDELLHKEKQAAASTTACKNQTAGTKQSNSSRVKQKKDIVSDLQKEGKRMREEFTYQQGKDDYINEVRSKQNIKEKLQERQIKLKWSTRRSSTNKRASTTTKESIQQSLQEFGSISSIEMIQGDKKNTALVTFLLSSSCIKCVAHYLHSDVMRASFIGKKHGASRNLNPSGDLKKKQSMHHLESVHARMSRQAAERESVIREMEEEEDNGGTGSAFHGSGTKQYSSSFPCKMPLDIGLHSLERLERYEMLYIPKEFRIH